MQAQHINWNKQQQQTQPNDQQQQAATANSSQLSNCTSAKFKPFASFICSLNEVAGF